MPIDKMGVSLLECCYFDGRDSIFLAINHDNVRDGCYDGGYGPNNKELTTRKQKREEERASQLGEDLLNFGVTSRLTNPNKKKQIEPPETGCYPPKKKKKCRGNAPEKTCYNKKCPQYHEDRKNCKVICTQMAISSHRNNI